jgi:hypothetical protein
MLPQKLPAFFEPQLATTQKNVFFITTSFATASKAVHTDSGSEVIKRGFCAWEPRIFTLSIYTY